jgi:hypothetical protein
MSVHRFDKFVLKCINNEGIDLFNYLFSTFFKLPYNTWQICSVPYDINNTKKYLRFVIIISNNSTMQAVQCPVLHMEFDLST